VRKHIPSADKRGANDIMKAYRLHRYGGPEGASLDDAPTPAVGPSDLLVKTVGVSLNPVDYKTRQGALKVMYRPKLPATLGNDLSGDVIAIGSAVTQFKIGDKVIACSRITEMGSFAEIARIDEGCAALAPSTIDLAVASGLPLAGQTAQQVLRDLLHVRPGMHVLITAGAGGVGCFAIQLAKLMGAEVTTTASPRGEALVRSLGADHVIDYTATDLASVGRTFDAVFDLAGREALEACFKVARRGATVISIAGLPTPSTASKELGIGTGLKALFWLASFGLRRKAAANGVSYHYYFLHPRSADLAALAAQVDAGTLKIVVDKSFTFENIADAIAHLEVGRAKGKVIVTF
jgi:NADPH:quinone reductase-like Zn-dependent oxidoreductase